jgi:hypothetical protein
MFSLENFRELLEQGQIGESIIARWFIRRGNAVLPVYEKVIDTGKGPQLFCLDGSYAAPDLLLFSKIKGRVLWIEAKHKSVFSWHRISQCWTTGIDRRHYREYQKVMAQTEWPVYLMFLHRFNADPNRPEDPWPCPTGLFGQRLDVLTKCENHQHDNWGTSGMVYWRHESLTPDASLEDLGL